PRARRGRLVPGGARTPHRHGAPARESDPPAHALRAVTPRPRARGALAAAPRAQRPRLARPTAAAALEIAEAERLQQAVRVDLHAVELVEEEQQPERDENDAADDREDAEV